MDSISLIRLRCSKCAREFLVQTKFKEEEVGKYICFDCVEKRNKRISKSDKVIDLDSYRRE